MLLQSLSLFLKVVIACMVTGMILTYFDLTAEGILGKFGWTTEDFILTLEQGVAWALPNIVLGAFVIIPIWLLVILIYPHKGE